MDDPQEFEFLKRKTWMSLMCANCDENKVANGTKKKLETTRMEIRTREDLQDDGEWMMAIKN